MTPKLTPPDQNPEQPDLQSPAGGNIEPAKTNLRVILLVAFTLFAILDIGILAYIFLSDRNENTTKPAQEQTRPAPANTSPNTIKIPEEQSSPDPTSLIKAQEIRAHWLQQQAIAEAEAIRSWGGTQYSVITSQAAAGEQFLADRRYQKAEEYFQQATEALTLLLAARPDMLQQALHEGDEALKAENSLLAAKAFNRALALAPENQQATAGLARAQTLDQTLLLYHQGLAAEAKADLKNAETMFKQAQKLDPDFLPAGQALARILAAKQEKAFQLAMGRFLQAIAAKNVAVAQKALQQAGTLRPQSPAVLNGKKQLQQLIKQQSVARLQQECTTYARAEQWQQAAQSCKQALTIAPKDTFALAGLQEATRRMQLAEALQQILDHPERLQEQGPLEEAKKALAHAKSVTDAGPKLQAQRAAVRQQIQAASRQIPLVLQSDNSTEIVVYRVGQLGKFNRRELQLRPGRYTVVGSRPGYRDVRHVIEIKSDDKQVHLQILCTEVI